MVSATEALNDQGFVWFRRALSQDQLNEIASSCDFGTRPGHRLRADLSFLSLLSAGTPMGDVSGALLKTSKPVRLVAFNKSADTNWAVPWHQDRVIAVREKCDLPEYKNWTRQGSYWHVEPPECVLRDMIFARIHFDATNQENGAMELAPGTHKLGAIAAGLAQKLAEQSTPVVCNAAPGDVLFVKALTLHRSKAAKKATMRRALRVDYAAVDLPSPLKWAFAPE